MIANTTLAPVEEIWKQNFLPTKQFKRNLLHLYELPYILSVAFFMLLITG